MKQIKRISVVLFFMFLSTGIFCQPTPDTWARWKYLIGEWTGEGGGKPGQGSGSFSFKTELNKTILVRKNHSEFPSKNGQAGGVHDDLMIIYANPPGEPRSAIYFDSEGHTINYTIDYLVNSIVFVSEEVHNLPQYRLTYSTVENNKVNIKFEMARPGDKEGFKTYVDGKCIKVK
jgi:hypothetical protein